MLSDLTFCVEAQTFVFTDQTQLECSTEHECPEGTKCPLDGCFADGSETCCGGEKSVLE